MPSLTMVIIAFGKCREDGELEKERLERIMATSGLADCLAEYCGVRASVHASMRIMAV